MSTGAHSPAASSPEDYDGDSNSAHEGQWQAQDPHRSLDLTSPSADDTAASSGQGPRIPLPMPKRRRVTRACDECRRKKIKCDGKQPCTHCTVYSYGCTYDQPSNRRRNPAPQYIEAIEARLHQAEALLRAVLPDIDLDDPRLADVVPQAVQVSGALKSKASDERDVREFEASTTAVPAGGNSEKDSMLESMVQSTGSLDLDDRGYWDFHGHSSGMIFLRRLREQFGDLMGAAEGHGAVFQQSKPLIQVFDSPRSASDSPANTFPEVDLPSRECGFDLCASALDDGCALMRFVHKPTFYAMLERIYSTPVEQYGNDENKYLPLVYATMAVGFLFAKSENSKLQKEGYANATDQGFQFFKAARQLMDVTDCRDLPSLQTILLMIIFLQSSAKLATCYSYIGIALHCAVRMGLHRSISRNFNPIELETRKRIFWQIRKMDLYVAALLGLPLMLSDDDIDQELPAEVDDEYITADKILPMPVGEVPLVSGINAHTRLTWILQKVVKYIYPLKGLEHSQNRSDHSYVVSHARIKEIEQDLQKWMESLPAFLRPGGEVSPDLVRVQQLLRMSYAHVQMMLYRPFLHYVSQSYHSGNVDKRSYACAAACVSVSRNVIHITVEMKRRGLLVGAYWFTMYTTFFAILALIYFVLENPESSTRDAILRDANEGKEVLASLAQRSMAADRCTQTLASLFDQLPEKLGRRASEHNTVQRKRNAPSPLPQAYGVQSTPNLPETLADQYGNVPRASTFPKVVSNLATWKRQSVPYSHPSPTIDHYRRSSHDHYTPSTSDQAGIMTPDSGGSSSSAVFPMTQQPYPMQQQAYNAGGLSDLSAMMFPDPNPFAYPNQPMTMLEKRQFIKPEHPFNPSDAGNLYSGTPTTGGAGYDNLEVQFYGPMPPYMLQGQPPGMGLPMGGMEVLGSGDGAWGSQPARTGTTPGVDMDAIFGNTWKAGWVEQRGYGP